MTFERYLKGECVPDVFTYEMDKSYSGVSSLRVHWLEFLSKAVNFGTDCSVKTRQQRFFEWTVLT